MSSSYQRYHPDNDNPAPGLLATGALAAGGLSTIALMNDGTLLKDLNKKGRDNPYLLDEDLIEDKYYSFRGSQ